MFGGADGSGRVETTFSAVVNDPAASAIEVVDGHETELVVGRLAGTVLGHPGHRFGDGLQELRVRVDAAGDAWVTGGFVTVEPPAFPDLDSARRIDFVREDIVLLPQGALARRVVLRFPSGFGITPDMRARTLRARHAFATVFLDGDLRPREDLVLQASDLGGEAVFGYRDGVPVWFASPWMRWRISEGELELGPAALRPVGEAEDDRMDQVAQLPAGVLADPAMARRLSNADLFRSVRDTEGAAVRIQCGTNGAAALDAVLTFGPGEFAAHFPRGLGVGWDGAGRLVIRGDRVVAGESRLARALPSELQQADGCPDNPCSAKAGSIAVRVEPDEADWRFTADLGLAVAGRTSAQRLVWGGENQGRPVHSAGSWTDASVLLAGSRLAGIAREGRPASEGPGALMLSGHGSSGDSDRVERPGSDAYEREGLADYPGINFRVSGARGFDGESILGGRSTGVYPLTGESRFHVRPAGVNGRLDTRGFPVAQRWYGFDFRVEGFSLAWRDSRNVDSRTSGRLEVPFPAGFSQGFRNLTFGCGGRLAAAEPADPAEDLRLDHWATPFRTRAVSFRPASLGGCAAPEDGILVLGMDVQVPLIRRPLPAVLGFVVRDPMGARLGDLTKAADGVGLDSRIPVPVGATGLRLPAVTGPGFGFTPVTGAYFSQYQTGGASRDGFLNLAGGIRVAFFEALQAHVHVQPQLGIAGIHVMGGWAEAGRNHFNDPVFDASHRGHPVGIDLETYRTGGAVGEYLPRVRQTWLDFARLDLPVKWAGAARRVFVSGGDGDLDLRLLRLPARVDELGPTTAVIGVGIEVKDLARFSTDRLLADAAGARTGLQRILSEAMGDAARAVGITAAVEEMDALTSPRSDGWFASPLRRAADPLVTSLVQAYTEAHGDGSRPIAAVRADFCNRVDGILGGDSIGLALDRLMQGAGTGPGLIEDLRGRVAKVHDGVTSARDILARGPDGRRPVVGELARRLARSPEAGILLQQLADETIAAEVEGLGATLDVIHDALVRVSEDLRQVEAGLGGGGEVGASIQGATASGPRVVALGAEIRAAVCDRLARLDGTPGRVLLEHPPSELREMLHAEIRDRVLASVVPERVGLILRAVLEPSRGIFRQALDGLFAELNRSLRTAVARQFGDAVLPADVREAEGALAGRLRAARLNGQVRIRDETLDGVRVEGRLELVLEDPQKPFTFHGWIEAGNQHADQPPSDCRPAGARDVTVRIGAESSGVAGYGERADGAVLKTDVDLRVALAPGSGKPLGMDGVVGLKGTLDVGDFGLRDARLRLAAGLGGNFLSGVVRGDLNGIDADIRFFLGQACDPGALGVLDPATAEVLTLPEYQPARRPGGGLAGFYVGADGTFPLEKLLGLPTTPAISLRGSGGNAWFGFAVLPAPGHGSGILIGRRIHQGVDGRVLGAVTVRGDYHLAGALGLVIPPGRRVAGFLPDPTELGLDAILAGAGSVEAKAGVGPLKVGGSVPVKVLLKLRPALRPPGFPPFSEACYRIAIGDLVTTEGCTP